MTGASRATPRQLWGVGMMVAAASLAACATLDSPPRIAVSSAECEASWATSKAREIVDHLERASVEGPEIWPGYGLAAAAYVLDAGTSPAGRRCLGVWRAGAPLDFAAFQDSPKLLTPLYGYYFGYPERTGPMAVLADAATQPPSIAEWLADLGLHSAVVVPVRVEGLGVEITPLQQSQTALHEAFHVHVQAPRWIANGGEWPAWDLQPDRAGVAACYRGDANVEFALADEQAALDRLVSALLDGAREAACNAGTDFLEHRALRYERAAEIVVARHDGEPGTCSDAEAILEAEEGTADFASWAVLHTIGEVTRDQLFGRYRAAQQAPYYVTGAMQLHGVYLMDPGGWLDVARRIARSTTIDDGSISTALASTLSSYCANDP